MTIQLEPGFWKTKGGHKVEILAIRETMAIGYIHSLASAHLWKVDGIYCGYGELSSIDIVSKWVEPKKVYKLNEMWCAWINPACAGSEIYHLKFFTKKAAQEYAIILKEAGEIPVAIIRADATEFFEGEGLEDTEKVTIGWHVPLCEARSYINR